MQVTGTTSARSILSCVLILGLGLESASADRDPHAELARPLPASNRSPVMGVYGIPRAQGIHTPGAGQTQWDATLDLASHFQASDKNSESIVFDGETARVAVQARHGLNDEWSLGVEVPWVHHGPGFLDHFIMDWHDIWGFAHRGRELTEKDAFTFRYERGGETQFDLQSSTGGIGDIVVSAQRKLWRGASSAAALHTQLKLPTGEAEKLTGSGAADAAVGVELSRRWRRGWHSMFRTGVVYLGDGDVLPDLQRSQAAYGGFDVVWRPVRSLSFRVQYDAHTSPYESSALSELKHWSGLLTTGGTWHITRRVALDLAVLENVPNASVAPDVSFQVRLRTTPGGGR